MTGRKIILLSDGTGNSSAKIAKTNVWRLYELIDQSRNDQIAIYDDGVGTGGVRVLRMIGGGFGFGLARNVRQLYVQLCRSYRPGDQIFLFGFSRGAFTVRLLSGLIQHCGIVDRSSDNTVPIWSWRRLAMIDVPVASDVGLNKLTRIIYRAVRKRNNSAPISRFVRFVRDLILSETTESVELRKRYSVSPRPRISFLGVFDTVSAYGLPIDEMTIVIHKWIYPLRFADMILSRKVQHACQVLALDEKRQTFHPMLWTERSFDPAGGIGESDKRPVQVWFPGMHSDAGGGYGDGHLSYVPLLWMIDEVRSHFDLLLNKPLYCQYAAQVTPLGKMHDSRSGFGSFYRYKPRILQELGDENLDSNTYTEVRIDRPKIHQSTFERIAATGGDYAPIGIPEDYDVIRGGSDQRKWETVSAEEAGYENPEQRKNRVLMQDNLSAFTSWNRGLYYAIVSIALALVAIPLIWPPNPAFIAESWIARPVGAIVGLITYFPLPKVDQIAEYWKQHPYQLVVAIVVIAVSYAASRQLTLATQFRAQQAWAHVAGRSDQLSGTHLLVSRNSGRWALPLNTWWSKRALPIIAVFLLFVLLPGVVGWRYWLFHRVDYSSVCSHLSAHASATRLAVATNRPCTNTGFQMKEGHHYEVIMEITSPWSDGEIPANPLGLVIGWNEWPTKLKMASAVLMRRFIYEDWFVPIGSIGTARRNAFPLNLMQTDDGKYTATIRAWRTGIFYIFINDAIAAWPTERYCLNMDRNTEWNCFYTNNSGTATLQINDLGNPD